MISTTRSFLEYWGRSKSQRPFSLVQTKGMLMALTELNLTVSLKEVIWQKYRERLNSNFLESFNSPYLWDQISIKHIQDKRTLEGSYKYHLTLKADTQDTLKRHSYLLLDAKDFLWLLCNFNLSSYQEVWAWMVI